MYILTMVAPHQGMHPRACTTQLNDHSFENDMEKRLVTILARLRRRGGTLTIQKLHQLAHLSKDGLCDIYMKLI